MHPLGHFITAAVLAAVAAVVVACGGGSATPAAGSATPNASTAAFPAEPAPFIPPGVPSLKLVNEIQLGPRLWELTFETPALAESSTKVRVLLPKGYEANPTARYPSLYLLHGCCNGLVAGGGYSNWTDALQAEAITADTPLIVVMPEGGRGGFYSNWYNNGAGGTPQWETYHIHQLRPFIDQHYRTHAVRSQRAIAGLSMGGFGAFAYAARHPELFVAAASYSGVVDNMDDNLSGSPFAVDALAAQDGGVVGSIWGQKATEEIRYRAHNPIDLAENLRGMALSLRTGNGLPGGPLDTRPSVDPLEVYCGAATDRLHAQLDTLGIAHVYDNYGPGSHSGPYWSRGLQQTLPILSATFAQALPFPSTFRYTTEKADFGQYGYTVSLKRAVLEFSTLEGLGGSGFKLSGSGSATVVTPALFKAGQALKVTVKGPVAQEVSLMADPSGRLTVPVDLGPSNTAQAYTATARALGTTVNTATVTISPQ